MEEDANCLLSDAYAFFQQGLYFDEDGQKDDALKMYENGVVLFDGASKLKNAKDSEMYDTLLETKSKVTLRIVELKDLGERVFDPNEVENIRKLLESTRVDDAELIYWLPEGVQLTIIQNDSTSASTPPSALAILKLNEKVSTSSQNGPAAMMQVGPWTYPLYPGKSSILRNEFGVYIVPNPTAESPDMFVGIILPRNINPRLEEEFLYVLNQYGIVRSSEIVSEMTPEEQHSISQNIASFLIKSGDVFAQTVNNAAARTGEFITYSGNQYRANMEPHEGAPVNISPAIRYSVFVLHKGSKLVAKVTSQLLNKIGEVGESIGRSVAESVSSESSGGRLVRGTFTVVGSGITGVSTAWIALEDAAKTLFRNFSDETVQTVQMRYGDEASETAHHALHAIGHTALASFQLSELAPRSAARHMARRAGIQFVQGQSASSPPPIQPTKPSIDKEQQ